MRDRDTWTDQGVERMISRLLLVGVTLATLVVVAGGGVLLARHGHETTQLGTFRGEPAELSTLAGVVAGVRALEPHAVVQLGLALLIATPIARVVLALYAFARQRDGIYVLVTSVVLAVLLLGLLSA